MMMHLLGPFPSPHHFHGELSPGFLLDQKLEENLLLLPSTSNFRPTNYPRFKELSEIRTEFLPSCSHFHPKFN